jgi:hypothetical protein
MFISPDIAIYLSNKSLTHLLQWYRSSCIICSGISSTLIVGLEMTSACHSVTHDSAGGERGAKPDQHSDTSIARRRLCNRRHHMRMHSTLTPVLSGMTKTKTMSFGSTLFFSLWCWLWTEKSVAFGCSQLSSVVFYRRTRVRASVMLCR